jgi:hypothetical protein
MLYSEIIAVCSQIHTKQINTQCGQNVELLNVKHAPSKKRQITLRFAAHSRTGGPQLGICFISLFWYPKYGGGSWISGKYVDACSMLHKTKCVDTCCILYKTKCVDICCMLYKTKCVDICCILYKTTCVDTCCILYKTKLWTPVVWCTWQRFGYLMYAAQDKSVDTWCMPHKTKVWTHDVCCTRQKCGHLTYIVQDKSVDTWCMLHKTKCRWKKI